MALRNATSSMIWNFLNDLFIDMGVEFAWEVEPVLAWTTFGGNVPDGHSIHYPRVTE